MNKLFISLLIVGSLILIGAGCNKTNQEDSKNITDLTGLNIMDDNNISSLENEVDEENISNFMLFGTVLGPKKVEFTWTAPEEIDFSRGFRILSSSQPEPKIPGAYWDWIPGSRTDIVLADVISGKRYFRICQWLGDACGEYSNEIVLQVE